MFPLIGSYVHHNRECAAIVVLSIQTDFAARSQEAITAANRLAMLAVGYQVDQVDELLNNDGQEILDELRSVLKEKIDIKHVTLIDGVHILRENDK